MLLSGQLLSGGVVRIVIFGAVINDDTNKTVYDRILSHMIFRLNSMKSHLVKIFRKYFNRKPAQHFGHILILHKTQTHILNYSVRLGLV